jgi:hypothetical protein
VVDFGTVRTEEAMHLAAHADRRSSPSRARVGPVQGRDPMTSFSLIILDDTLLSLHPET